MQTGTNKHRYVMYKLVQIGTNDTNGYKEKKKIVFDGLNLTTHGDSGGCGFNTLGAGPLGAPLVSLLVVGAVLGNGERRQLRRVEEAQVGIMWPLTLIDLRSPLVLQLQLLLFMPTLCQSTKMCLLHMVRKDRAKHVRRLACVCVCNVNCNLLIVIACLLFGFSCICRWGWK